MDIAIRFGHAVRIAEDAGRVALDYFHRRDDLDVIDKGPQDFVTEADQNVEAAIRAALAEAMPEDGIVGEEHAPVTGKSGFTWVIDPIDGTANFVTGIPAWTVVLAGVAGPDIEIGVIHDPVHGETFAARKGGGATLNGRPIQVAGEAALIKGSVGLGFSGRADKDVPLRLATGILNAGGVFVRNGSGALSLAYTAAGRFLGYAEAHMNAWDCLAGQLLVTEAGGQAEDQDAQAMIAEGGRVVCAAPGVFEDLLRLTKDAMAGPT